MPIVNKVSAAVFEEPAKPVGRQPSPEQLALITKISSLKTEKDAYEVLLTGDEKPATVRQQIGRAAKTAGVEIVVKRSPHGFYIGLMTPERRARSGRRPPSAGRKMLESRRESSAATWSSVSRWPEPVGHSTVNESPR